MMISSTLQPTYVLFARLDHILICDYFQSKLVLFFVFCVLVSEVDVFF